MRDRRAGGLPRPRGLRPALRRHGPPRPDQRRALPARRPWRPSPGSPAPGCATSSRTARSTTRSCTTRRRPRPSPRPYAATTRRCPCSACPGSVWLAVAEAAGLTPVAEAFADRAYTPEGTLVSRREPDAVLHDPDEVAERSVRMATRQEVVAADGSVVAVRAGSVCVHGDSPGAVAMATAVRRGLEEAGVRVAPFVGGDAGMRLLPVRRLRPAGRAGGPRRGARALRRARRGPARGRRRPGPGRPHPDAAHRPRPHRPRPGRPGGAGGRGRGRATAPTPGCVEVPVTYDGEDLAEVGRLTGLGERGVVEAHTAQEWTVAFCGFAPGFGYLVGTDERLHRAAARRPAHPGARPRAVALAGEFTGVYPRESPGRLAADRAHHPRAVGPRARPAGPAGARRPRPVRGGVMADRRGAGVARGRHAPAR